MKFRQYIPVKATSGGSNPDPAVYCPANGYILEYPEDYVSPVTVPVPSDEQIILLCKNEGSKYIRVQCGISGGQWYVEVYDGDGNYIETSANVNNGQYFEYFFPAGYDYFIFKFKLTGAYSFTYYRNTYSAPYNGDYPILEARFNTPNITSLQNAFYQVTSIQSVSFFSTLENLTSMSFMFYKGGLQKFTFPASLPALTTCQNMFYMNNYIVFVDMSGASVPLLQNLRQICWYCPALMEFKFPASLPEVTDLYGAFSNTPIKKVQMHTSAPKVTNYSYMFASCGFLTGDIIVPESQVCTTISNFCYRAYKVNKIEFIGHYYACSQAPNVAYEAKLLTELIFPRTVGALSLPYSSYQSTEALKRIVFPDYDGGTSSAHITGSLMGVKIEEFSGDSDLPNGQSCDFYYPNIYVNTVNMPKRKCYRVWIGHGSKNAPVTYINIDWANSDFNDNYTPACINLYCELDATEINRIFGLLPVVTGTQAINVQLCPGYATCNPSIATAKGWTVL